MEDTEIEAPIRSWMERVVEGRRDRSFDDLHVDDISARFAPRTEWVGGALESLKVARRIRDAARYPFAVAAGFALVPGSIPQGLAADGVSQLEGELDDSPPSLYLFAEGGEPWIEDAAFRTLPDFQLPAKGNQLRAFLREWYDDRDSEFRRSFWLAV